MPAADTEEKPAGQGLSLVGTGPSTSRLADGVGKHGVLRLRLASRCGRTVVADQYWRMPLQVMPPSYQDDDDEAYVYLLNPTGGIVQGDRLDTAVTVESGARCVLSTQSATKIYRMDDDQAEEATRLALRGDAVLEYLPDQIIPFAGSRFVRHTRVELDRESTLILTEVLAAGRVARGERFAFTQLGVELELWVGAELTLVDRSRSRLASFARTLTASARR